MHARPMIGALTNALCDHGPQSLYRNDDRTSRSKARHNLEFLAGVRVDSRDWSRAVRSHLLERIQISAGLLQSDKDHGDKYENKSTSTQARRKCEG